MPLYRRPSKRNGKRIGSIWWLSWTDSSGKRHQRSLQKIFGLPSPVTDRSDAKRLAAKFELDHISRALDIPVESDSPAVADYYKQFFDFFKRNRAPGTVKAAVERLGNWRSFLSRKGIVRMSGISLDLFNEFLDANLQGRSNATLNRYTSTVRASLEWGIRRETLKCWPQNPLKYAVHHREPKPDRTFSFLDQDLEKLFGIDDPLFLAFLKVVYYSLARRSEIVKLRWEDVDLKKGLIKFRLPKSQEPEVVEMADCLTPVFSSIQQNGDCLFPYSENHATRKFRELSRQLGLKSLRKIHDLRGARVFKLLSEGEDIETVRQLARHKSVLTTLKFYSSTTKERRRQAVNRP